MTPSWSTLPPTDLKKTIKDNARAMNVAVLRSQVDGAIFDVEPFARQDPIAFEHLTPQQQAKQALELWSCRLRQICSFSRNATLSTRLSALPGMTPLAYQVPVLTATDEFRDWFMQATLALADAWPRAMASVEGAAGPNTGLVEMARWMACACMLDMPQAVRAIHAACPRAFTFTVALSNLFEKRGVALGFEVTSLELNASPVWVAWQFSAGKCLDVFAEVSQKIQPDAQIGLIMMREKYHTIKSLPTSLSKCFTGADCRLVCDNETFQRAIAVVSRSQVFKDVVELSAQSALKYKHREGRLAVPHRIAAYLAEGVYNRQPTLSAINACLGGWPTLTFSPP